MWYWATCLIQALEHLPSYVWWATKWSRIMILWALPTTHPHCQICQNLQYPHHQIWSAWLLSPSVVESSRASWVSLASAASLWSSVTPSSAALRWEPAKILDRFEQKYLDRLEPVYTWPRHRSDTCSASGRSRGWVQAGSSWLTLAMVKFLIVSLGKATLESPIFVCPSVWDRTIRNQIIHISWISKIT